MSLRDIAELRFEGGVVVTFEPIRCWHDKAAAKRFFKRVLRLSPVPRKIVTDQLRSNPAAKAEIPELANMKHVFVKAAAQLNNRM